MSLSLKSMLRLQRVRQEVTERTDKSCTTQTDSALSPPSSKRISSGRRKLHVFSRIYEENRANYWRQSSLFTNSCVTCSVLCVPLTVSGSSGEARFNAPQTSTFAPSISTCRQSTQSNWRATRSHHTSSHCCVII